MDKNYFDFHTKDIEVRWDEDWTNYCAIRENEKRESWAPFLSFPITKSCNFHCIYCGMGGEATGSESDKIAVTLIKAYAELGIKNGIRKFRITGGEPLLHHDIQEILHYFSELGFFTLVNSNGSLISRRQEIFDGLNSNIKFAVSLDTLVPKKLSDISGATSLNEIIEGIHFLNQHNHLLRCNMVVGQYNISEVFDIIKFCQELGCDLKILDIVSVPVPYGKRSDFYQEVTSLETSLMEKCDSVYSHEYSRGFGTPCLRYRFGDTYVTVKNSRKGSHYDNAVGGICEKCSYFPCHEGLYDIFALSDGRLCACRWTERQEFADPEKQLCYLIDAFKRSKFILTGTNNDMKTRKELIKK